MDILRGRSKPFLNSGDLALVKSKEALNPYSPRQSRSKFSLHGCFFDRSARINKSVAFALYRDVF